MFYMYLFAIEIILYVQFEPSHIYTNLIYFLLINNTIVNRYNFLAVAIFEIIISFDFLLQIGASKFTLNQN